jgi:hypothetical protein
MFLKNIIIAHKKIIIISKDHLSSQNNIIIIIYQNLDKNFIDSSLILAGA